MRSAKQSNISGNIDGYVNMGSEFERDGGPTNPVHRKG